VSRRRGAWTVLLLGLAACAHRPAGPEAAPPAAPVDGQAALPSPEQEPRAQVGLASFYGRRHRGRRTASGARYDPAAFTCAHRTEPFGVRLAVTDLDTGRSVVVTVNDRGPFVRGRVIDLSLAAARALGMVERGVARVRVERVEP
jgi:rare lipoprotein A